MKTQKSYSLSKHFLASYLVTAALLVSPYTRADTVREGPSGRGENGYSYNDIPPPRPNYVDYILVRHGDWIDSIQTFWLQGKKSARHGGGGGGLGKYDPSPGIINWVSGSYDSYVQHIFFCGNRKNPVNGRYCSKVFGKPKGQHFSYEAPLGYEIVGFHGNAGQYLNTVGVVIRKYR